MNLRSENVNDGGNFRVFDRDSYGVGSVLRFGRAQRRAVAIEVGMQNSGLAVALAAAHFGP